MQTADNRLFYCEFILMDCTPHFIPFFVRFQLGGQKEDKNLLRRTKSITFVL